MGENVFESNSMRDWLDNAFDLIRSGTASKLEHPNKLITIYKCGSIIRVDIKGVFKC